MSHTNARFSEWEYRNIALSVVTQCAMLVRDLAVEGKADRQLMQQCLRPVYLLDADSVSSLYPEPGNFDAGMKTLQESFDSSGLKQHADVVRYLLGMLVLQQQLRKNKDMMNTVAERISHLAATENQDENPEDLPEQAWHADCAALARLYQDTISRLNFRIHVAGNPEHLREQQVADQIRALLFAGIRSAVLWHQLGGRRWHLFFYKKRIRQCLTGVRRKMLH
ncbi:high frequency lysogenization protein HflD [Pseudohongiella nitratireducens]|uniref:high frequency lysogenization protein HflD n=1 Tax=Pseudohongiella nitratireducens TaxID=1768907 RepID=UPI002409D942|nr:high frequency lysogenization protein HflD [Pseudohongiella nitratireducens]MDF1622819.1 high frequency lysogenization protein HflD [Pseudohongiella nitratireducens]